MIRKLMNALFDKWTQEARYAKILSEQREFDKQFWKLNHDTYHKQRTAEIKSAGTAVELNRLVAASFDKINTNILILNNKLIELEKKNKNHD